jgi:hypothetical protein
MKGEIMKTMMTMKTKRTSLKLSLMAPLVVASLSMAPHAWADSILMAQTTLVSGTESTVDSFTAPTAGTVTVSLQSLNWPTALNALSFSATSATQVLAAFDGTGLSSQTASFDVGAGTYFAHIVASAGGTLDLGLYSLMMTFSATPTVPVPSSGWLLLTGMFVIAGLARAVRPFDLTGTAAA